MEFEYSKKTKMYMEQLTDFMNKHVYPNEQVFHDQLDSGADALAGAADHGRAQGQGARARPLEPVPARERARRRPHQPRVRAAVRDHGPRRRSRPRSSTARRPTPATWRCSSATAPPSSKKQWLRAAARRRDPLGLRDDRAGVASSDATNIESSHRARRRRLRHQRPQVVDLRRRRSALQGLHLHGQDRSRRTPTATSSSR